MSPSSAPSGPPNTVAEAPATDMVRRLAPAWRLLRPHHTTAIVAACGMAGHAATTGLYAYLIGPLLAFLFTGGNAGYGAFFALVPGVEPEGLDTTSLTIALPAVILVVAALKGLAYYVQFVALARIGQGVGVRLRLALFDALMATSPAHAMAASRGDLAARMGADVESIHIGLVEALAAVVRDGLTLFVLMALAVWLDWPLALVAFVVLPVAFIPIVRFGRRLRRSTFEGHQAHGRLGGLLVEALANRDLLRTEEACANERGRIHEQVETIARARLRAATTKALSHPIMEFLGVGGLAATLWFAAFRIWSGALDPADFVSFFAAVLMLYEPLKGMARGSGHLHEAAAGLDRLGPLLELPPASTASHDAPALERHLQLDAVTLEHGTRTILEDVSLHLPARTTAVLCGASGAGKTTLLRAMANLHPPSGGRVRWDTHDYATLHAARLARRIGYLDQDARCFGRTIRENLCLGVALEDQVVWDALTDAGAEAFVRTRGGLDAPLREGGADLSGGQRRRLALARAFAHRPDLLLLDEPTESVDPATQEQLLATLRRLHGLLTIVVVAHRAEQVPWADYVIDVDARGVRLRPPSAPVEAACA